MGTTLKVDLKRTRYTHSTSNGNEIITLLVIRELVLSQSKILSSLKLSSVMKLENIEQLYSWNMLFCLVINIKVYFYKDQ